MTSEEGVTKLALKAKVQWWDNENIHVLCPLCDKIHRHSFNKDYFEHGLCTAPCNLKHSDEGLYSEYEIEFPQGIPSGNSFEIDKEKFRFIAGGARLPKISNPKLDPRNVETSVEERIKEMSDVKAKHPKDISDARIDTMKSEMMKDNVDDVSGHLKKSPCQEVDFFLRHSDTSGETVLHIAARELSPKMVRLFLKMHAGTKADVNAINRDGRTALMEAALWGRIENVLALLEYGADVSKKCINNNQLMCAADFAKALEKNARRRRSCANSDRMSKLIGEQDTDAGAGVRRAIVRLLEDAADKPDTRQLGAFVYQLSVSGPATLSLTTSYNLADKSWKTVARMIRGGGLPEITAMSGWGHKQTESIHLAGQTWTNMALRLCELIKFDPESDEEKDQGIPGQYNASHAEKQLITYFVYKHLFVSLPAPKVLKVAEEQGIESGMSGLTLGDSKEQELADLKEASPKNPLKSAIILSSNRICDDCISFTDIVNSKLDLDLLLRHCCVNPKCTLCQPVPQAKPSPIPIDMGN
ncbi:DYW family of nucleic acid deaminases-domain-containing protein [Daldinia eschscholtzii]|nr:DYW family of nucleic acid deaminases-domain-containing protein [Daldinia eschscholtzii]